MVEAHEALKFRIMMCLLGPSSAGCTVTGISRTLNEEKYVISRMMIRMEQEGLLDRTNERAPMLTEKGRTEAERYRERVALAQNYLLHEGVGMEHVQQDACGLALYASDELMEMIRFRDERFRIKRELCGKGAFSGAILSKYFRDGSYSFPFTLYSLGTNGSNCIAMVNDIAEQPCTLSVEHGECVIQLKLLPQPQNERSSGTAKCGKISKLEYVESGRFVSAEFHGDVVSFPASVLHFVRVGMGAEQMLHGSAGFRMQYAFGTENVSESDVLFTMLI